MATGEFRFLLQRAIAQALGIPASIPIKQAIASSELWLITANPSKGTEMTIVDQEFNPYTDDPLFSAIEAAKYIGVSKSTFHKLVRDGAFPVVMFFADMRVRRSDLNHFVRGYLETGSAMKGENN